MPPNPARARPPSNSTCGDVFVPQDDIFTAGPLPALLCPATWNSTTPGCGDADVGQAVHYEVRPLSIYEVVQHTVDVKTGRESVHRIGIFGGRNEAENAAQQLTAVAERETAASPAMSSHVGAK